MGEVFFIAFEYKVQIKYTSVGNSYVRCNRFPGIPVSCGNNVQSTYQQSVFTLQTDFNISTFWSTT